MPEWIVVLLYVLVGALMGIGVVGAIWQGGQMVADWPAIRNRMPFVIGPIRIGKPPPIIITPTPAVITIDRTPVQMVRNETNKMRHRLRRFWHRRRHGL